MRRKENYCNIMRIYSPPTRAAGHAHKYLTLLGKEREVTKKSCLSKPSKQIPQSLNMLTLAPTKTKSHAKQILCSSYKRVQSEPLWKYYNRRVITSFQQENCEDVFIHCLVLPKGKGIPKEKSNRFKEFLSDKVCSSSKAVPPVTCQTSFLLMPQHQHILPRWTAQVSTAATLKDQSASKCQCSYILSCA